MKILVLGGSGMAGHMIALYLNKKGISVDTISLHNKLDNKTKLIDIENTHSLEKYLDKHEYKVIINCVALLSNQCDKNRLLAIKLNTVLPLFLEKKYSNSATKIIHLSTDAVFSGKKICYFESDLADGETFYGRSKYLGEINNNKDLTIRLSIIGPTLQKQGTGIFNWYFQQKEPVKGFANAMWCGITTLELANAVESFINNDVSGLYHLAPRHPISKLDLLKLIRKISNNKTEKIVPSKGSTINTNLKSNRKDFQYDIPSYESMLLELKQWIQSHKALYKHYEL